MLDEVAEYSYKAKILRQIQSNRALRFGHVNSAQNVATVIVSAFLTFAGFSGIEKLQTYLGASGAAHRASIELTFNIMVFLLFVLVILHLVFRFNTRQGDAEAAVVTLTAFVNEVEDILSVGRRGNPLGPQDLDLVRHKYETVIRVIPPNTDREYRKARQDFRDKETRRAVLELTAAEVFNGDVHERALVSLIQASPTVLHVLHTMHGVDRRLYLGGSLVRNLVWDYLHGYDSPTPIEDVDVVYFDKLSNSKGHDTQLEQQLRKGIGNLRWSVKNQARMHLANNDSEYTSLEDAVSKWPETCTAFVLQMTDDDKVSFVAPHSFRDLFRLVVRPTPHFGADVGRLRRYQSRVGAKNWSSTWPRLQILGLDQSVPGVAIAPSESVPGMTISPSRGSTLKTPTR